MSSRISAVPPLGGQVSRFPAERLGDAELVQAATRGDPDAISVIWDRYAALVRSVLRAALGPDLVAEGVLQDVFVSVIRESKTAQHGAALRRRLLRTALQRAVAELRRRKLRRWLAFSRNASAVDDTLLPRDATERQALRALYRVLDALGNRRRLAFVLRHVQGLEHHEVAELLELSEQRAGHELARARRQVVRRSLRDPALHAYLERLGGEVS